MDLFGSNEILVQSTLTNFLLALSLSICLRVGVFSFAGLACFGVGAYFTAVATIRWEWSGGLSMVAAVVLGAALCAVLAPILQGLSGLAMGMATIAVALIVGVIVVNGGELTGGAEGLFGVPMVLGTGVALAVAIALTAVVAYFEHGRMGRLVEAVRLDDQLSLSNGVPVRWVRFTAFVASGAVGALAGAMAASFRSIVTPLDLGFGPVVLALTMLIIGGSRSWVGALIGAAFFTWLPTALTSVGDWQGVIYGLVVAAAAVWVPGGVVGVVQDVARRGALRQRAKSAGSGAPSSEGMVAR
jgi:branched-chain amino acid transport system permease protein